MLAALLSVSAAAMAAAGGAQPQKVWPVGAVDDTIAAALSAAVKDHVAGWRPRVPASEEHVRSLQPPERHHLEGDFEAGKPKLQQHWKTMMEPRTEEERQQREAGALKHANRASLNMRAHQFNNKGSSHASRIRVYSVHCLTKLTRALCRARQFRCSRARQICTIKWCAQVRCCWWRSSTLSAVRRMCVSVCARAPPRTCAVPRRSRAV